MSNRKVEDLAARLEEAQHSLSVALARIEGYRCREKLLLRDFETLRLRARHADLDLLAPLPAVTPNKHVSLQQQQQEQQNGAAAGLQWLQQAASGTPSVAAAPQHLALTALNESHPLWLHTRSGKVPGTLLVAGDDLHFVQTHARVSAADYLGLRALKAEGRGHLQPESGDAGAAGGDDDASGAAVAPAGGRGGVLSGAAGWLAQRMRNSGGGGTGEDESPPSSGLGFTNIMTTIMHSLEEDGSSDEASASEAEPSQDSRSQQQAAAESARSGSGSGPTPYSGPHESPELQVWDVAWADEYGHMRRLAFEAGLPARAFIAKQTQRWAEAATARGVQSPPLSEAAFDGAPSVQVCSGCQAPLQLQGVAVQRSADERSLTARVFSALDLELAVPDHMRPTESPPAMREASGILSGEQARALAGALPPRYHLSGWTRLYSTEKNGISLQTLYRRSVAAPTLLLIRDTAGHVFGAFTSEGWRVATRFYGTGESFVFQLQPHRVAWRWRRAVSEDRNDFFQFGTPESLAVGGGGHFAIFLGEDLLRGSSGISSTFGNPCLAGSSEFTVSAVEVWSVNPT